MNWTNDVDFLSHSFTNFTDMDALLRYSVTMRMICYGMITYEFFRAVYDMSMSYMVTFVSRWRLVAPDVYISTA